MTAQEKTVLLTLIKGLTETIGETQRESGEEVIKGENLRFLIEMINKM